MCELALRRERRSGVVYGPLCTGPNGESVRFGCCAGGGFEYQASTCATLLAACEWLVEHPNVPDAIYEDLKGVPESKLQVLALAVEALRRSRPD